MRTIRVKTGIFIIIASTVLAGACKKDEPEKVTAAFSASATNILSGASIQFTNQSVNAQHYQWDFGDGGLSFEVNPTHAFEDAGQYNVKLLAIGKDHTDSTTVAITVLENAAVQIFEGVGIEGIDLYSSWGDLKSTFTSDTSYFLNFNEEVQVWFHIVFYPDEGIALGFPTPNATLGDEAEVFIIMLFEPYTGATEKDISIGSAFSSVLTAYGDAEIIEEEGMLAYWYSNLGIDFYSFDTDFVEEIDIYEPYEKKSNRSQMMIDEFRKMRNSLNQD